MTLTMDDLKAKQAFFKANRCAALSAAEEHSNTIEWCDFVLKAITAEMVARGTVAANPANEKLLRTGVEL